MVFGAYMIQRELPGNSHTDVMGMYVSQFITYIDLLGQTFKEQHKAQKKAQSRRR